MVLTVFPSIEQANSSICRSSRVVTVDGSGFLRVGYIGPPGPWAHKSRRSILKWPRLQEGGTQDVLIVLVGKRRSSVTQWIGWRNCGARVDLQNVVELLQTMRWSSWTVHRSLLRMVLVWKNWWLKEMKNFDINMAPSKMMAQGLQSQTAPFVQMKWPLLVIRLHSPRTGFVGHGY